MTPTRPGRPCAKPGCPRIVHGASYCAEHEATRRQKPEAQRRFYNSTWWKNLRALVRKQEPVCTICHERPSSNVDHVNGRWDDNRRENLRALCSECEKTRTAKQHRGKVG